jgi:hypothetical protein
MEYLHKVSLCFLRQLRHSCVSPLQVPGNRKCPDSLEKVEIASESGGKLETAQLVRKSVLYRHLPRNVKETLGNSNWANSRNREAGHLQASQNVLLEKEEA